MKARQRLGVGRRRTAQLICLAVGCFILVMLTLNNRTTYAAPPLQPTTRVHTEATLSQTQQNKQRPTVAAKHVDDPAMDILRLHNADAVEHLLTCENTMALHDSSDTDAELSRAHNADRYERCFHRPDATFLYFGNHWGRHFNQMTSLVSALVLSRMLNRTLIMPPLVFEKKRVQLHNLYDARRMYDNPHAAGGGSPFCVLTEDEFATLEAQRLGSPVTGQPLMVEAACISMRGIKQHPQLPRGFTFKCVEAPFIKFKKNLTLFFETVGHSSTRLLTIPLAIYYAQALPEAVVYCPWRLLAPHPVVSKAVAMLTSSSRHSSSSEPPTATIGVHLRALEGSCHSRQQQYRSREESLGLEQQCTMKADYVLRVAAGALASRFPSLVDSLSGGIAPKANIVSIVADDGQQPARADELTNALPHGVRTQQVVASSSASPVKKYLDTLRQSLTPSATIQPPYNLAYHSFHEVPGALPILLDFWTLANATVFVGNQVSTLSMNVCRYRRAVGLACDNFV